MKTTSQRFERWWAAGLIVIGVALLGIVFLTAFSVVSDPGGHYDKWVPADGPQGPEASFDWTSSNRSVAFMDTSSAGDAEIVRWAWEFGDGTASSDPNPSHEFAEEGEYSVTLDVVDDNGVSSQATGTVEAGVEGPGSGSGEIGMNDLADNLMGTVERSAKGGSIVLLVIGMFVVLTMIGGRLVRQGVRALRPIPDRIKVKLRPKELELAATDTETSPVATPETMGPSRAFVHDSAHEKAEQPVGTST